MATHVDLREAREHHKKVTGQAATELLISPADWPTQLPLGAAVLTEGDDTPRAMLRSDANIRAGVIWCRSEAGPVSYWVIQHRMPKRDFVCAEPQWNKQALTAAGRADQMAKFTTETEGWITCAWNNQHGTRCHAKHRDDGTLWPNWARVLGDPPTLWCPTHAPIVLGNRVLKEQPMDTTSQGEQGHEMLAAFRQTIDQLTRERDEARQRLEPGTRYAALDVQLRNEKQLRKEYCDRHDRERMELADKLATAEYELKNALAHIEILESQASDLRRYVGSKVCGRFDQLRAKERK